MEKIAIIGLGYVGLPLAVSLADHFDTVTGFEINQSRVDELKNGYDRTAEVDNSKLKHPNLNYTTNASKIKDASFIIVTVPTPVDIDRRPDLSAIKSACKTVGENLSKDAVVVFESTVYPGVTDDICGPLLEQYSGLRLDVDFSLGYSPERINPGDKVNTLETIVKVVGANDEKTSKRLQDVYSKVVKAGLHIAPSIKVAEASKVIENTQRDLNIALMNELALIFNKLGIRTKDVLEAAGSKWNFLKFTPGLVGGHCIGVDPYYLTSKAENIGYHPQLILTGRRVNEGMGHWIAEEAIKNLIAQDLPVRKAKIGIVGITFKEDVPDLRNSRVPDIVRQIRSYGIEPIIYDPWADGDEVKHEYDLELCQEQDLSDLDLLILAVPHKKLMEKGDEYIKSMLKQNGVVMDIKSALQPEEYEEFLYWSL